MKASAHWLNRLLEPAGLPSDEVEALLTNAGFPIDAREVLPTGDTRLEVEVTSNRGDCLSHIGLAREIAARTRRTVKHPPPPTVRPAGPVTDALRLQNNIPDSCPRFTAHVIRGITVKPSPAWLVEALESVGQRPINNVVDVTNYVNFLYGQPVHAFDLNKLAGRTLIVRMARDGEDLTTLDGKPRKLKPDEMVVADEHRAQSLAGIIGGADSEVGPDTRDVVLEAATWDPVAVRRAARRLQVRTDASHRFERFVDPRTIELPARLAAALIADLGGGSLCTGMLDAGPPPAPLRTLDLRVQRCLSLIGTSIDDAAVESILRSLELSVSRHAGTLRCIVPPFRPDLEREIDLVEEVARVHGLDRVPMLDRINVSIKPPQSSESAMRLLGTTLAGLGFFETVTFSFITPRHAAPFMPQRAGAIAVADDRRKLDGTLRPSTIPSLLTCRRANADAGIQVQGGIRLFEAAATFHQDASARAVERRTLALLLDIPGVDKGKPATIDQRQHGIRLLRGALESAARALGGGHDRLSISPAAPPTAAFEPAAYAQVSIDGKPAGGLGLISDSVLKLFDLATPPAAAEIDLESLLSLYPCRAKIDTLPAFPSIERDLSLIVDESTQWASINSLVATTRIDRLEEIAFLGTYRGKQIGPGKKSVTLRMRFRDPARTLRHEEVDPQVAAIVTLAGQKLGATLRV
jgi:phenylalanyl-tRNA synthetase beta chain